MSECQTKARNQEYFKKLEKLTHSRHAEQLLFSCVSSKVTVYRLEWQCVFVLNKFYNKVGIFLIFKGHNRLFGKNEWTTSYFLVKYINPNEDSV